MGWYFGFKLHLICNERGELLNFMLTKANVDDRNTDVFNRLSDNVFGKLFADKGYISHGLSHISVLPMLQKVARAFQGRRQMMLWSQFEAHL